MMRSRLADITPRTAPAPGQLLWGEAPRRQPIGPLVLMAVVLLIVAAPSAFASGGGSSNPLTLMRDIANTTYELTGLMQQSNDSLGNIDSHSKKMLVVQQNLVGISESSGGMATKTAKINETLGTVGATVAAQRGTLDEVDGKLETTASSMGAVRTDLSGSLRATKAVVGSFTTMQAAIGVMDTHLNSAIGEMASSGPLTKEFADNRTRVAIVGGNAEKFQVPNFAPNARVMSIVLPMIKSMQDGGALPARKDSQTASNPIVGTALKLTVPDGTNVAAKVVPYDGVYGLPGPQFFVENRIHGF